MAHAAPSALSIPAGEIAAKSAPNARSTRLNPLSLSPSSNVVHARVDTPHPLATRMSLSLSLHATLVSPPASARPLPCPPRAHAPRASHLSLSTLHPRSARPPPPSFLPPCQSGTRVLTAHTSPTVVSSVLSLLLLSCFKWIGICRRIHISMNVVKFISPALIGSNCWSG